MTPKYVVYECEECGRLFYREVAEVLIDDAEHCEVNVKLLEDANGELEEFPMCDCLGGITKDVVDLYPNGETPSAE